MLKIECKCLWLHALHVRYSLLICVYTKESSWCSTTDHFLNIEWNRPNLFLLANKQSKNTFKENACKVKNQSQSVFNYIFYLKSNDFYIFLVYFHVMYFVWFKIVSTFFMSIKNAKSTFWRLKADESLYCFNNEYSF